MVLSALVACRIDLITAWRPGASGGFADAREDSLEMLEVRESNQLVVFGNVVTG
jgi:hypothetical protein